MQIEYLQAFCTVYEQGSLTQAANKLGLSTPKMTRQLQQLESEINALLFHRSTRAITPTEAGELFYQQAKEILLQYESSLLSLQTLTTSISGTVKIGLPASISHLWITPTLHKLSTQYPELKFKIVIGNHLLDILSDGFDLIIHCGKLPNSGFYYQKLRDWHKVTCASPEYLKTNGTPKHPNELHKHNCIDHYDNFSNTWSYQIDGKPADIFIEGNIRSNSSIDLKNLALADMGIAYLPSFTVNDAIKSKKLKPILKKFTADSYEMYAVYPSKKEISKKLQVVLDYLNSVLP
ncbi:MAG: LysR family transcriptional regulator [Coxiellaceae bacterium]|nr:LysR family transcriptional regulator [Coxiellaceae bacterium]